MDYAQYIQKHENLNTFFHGYVANLPGNESQRKSGLHPDKND